MTFNQRIRERHTRMIRRYRDRLAAASLDCDPELIGLTRVWLRTSLGILRLCNEADAEASR